MHHQLHRLVYYFLMSHLCLWGQEYEDTSLMYKYVQEAEEINDVVVKTVDNEVNAEKAAEDAIAAADAVLGNVGAMQSTTLMKTVLDDPAAKSEYFKVVYEASLKEEKEKKAMEG